MLSASRFQAIAGGYASLRVALVGDFCLDRYLEIDPGREEVSIETGRPVHNVVRVRAQAGGAGTIANNLAALGIGVIYPLGFCGDDGEGYELRRCLGQLPGVEAGMFLQTGLRRTFTYCKPLVIEEGRPPRELDRLDSKNWSPTPEAVQNELIERLGELAPRVDAIILLDQVDRAETGVVTRRLLEAVARIVCQRPNLLILADSRRGLADYPPVCFKMNRDELAAMCGEAAPLAAARAGELARRLAAERGRPVIVTLSQEGMLAASAAGELVHAPALPTRGPIDIVGAGDCVTANLTAALAAGASLEEALRIASVAASLVVHQLGTTGTADCAAIGSLLEA